MIQIISKKISLLACIGISLFLFDIIAHAQETQVLSVTPPLFQLSALPGDIWQSSIKVVNGNSYPLTVYARVVNFEATGESGQGKFIPIMSEGEDKTTLGEWMSIDSGPYVIPPEQSKEVSFIVEIPKDASPGGHYAAVLISTEPPADSNTIALKTSQAVTSLFFVRIEGDVKEKATIREFRVTDAFLSTPEAEFSLRFENKGNVHLQPRGNIVITNMWGTERGIIPINHQTHFGNVLPQSIRDFKFMWKSEFKITDIGRYKATVALVYGQDGVKSEVATAYFWVIPVKGTLVTLAILALFIALVVFMVKAYIRKMLMLAGVPVGESERVSVTDEIYSRSDIESRYERRNTYRTVSAPIRNGVLDLRRQLSAVEETGDVITTVLHFVRAYKVFFISVCVLICIGVSTFLYIRNATQERNDYEVIIDEGDSTTRIQGTELNIQSGQ